MCIKILASLIQEHSVVSSLDTRGLKRAIGAIILCRVSSVSANVVFNESELYYKSETSSATASPKKEATNLAILRLAKYIPVHKPTITSANTSANAPKKDGEDARQMNPSPEEEDEQPEVEDSQDNVKVEADQRDSGALNEEPTLNSQVKRVDDGLGWPISLRKGVRSCRANVKYPIGHYVKYDKLSHQYRNFLTVLDNIVILNRVEDALRDPGWKAAMDKEMVALKENDTWELTTLPKRMKVIGCCWVFTPKLQANRTLERLKARLVAKGYTQTQGLDYGETSAPMAKFNVVLVLIALAAKCDREILQLDVKNVFLHGKLEEEVYIQLLPRISVDQ